jgi:hypothetical protein
LLAYNVSLVVAEIPTPAIITFLSPDEIVFPEPPTIAELVTPV